MRRFVSGILPCFLVLSCLAQEMPPPPLKEYQGRVIAQTMHWQGAGWLIRNKREREEAATQMREELQLKPGMAVCDLGSGNGYHTLPMAEAVGEGGKVFAVEIQPEMLQMLKERAAARKLTNIETIVSTPHDPRLPASSCDLILLVDVYHEFSHPEQMLAGIRKALKPDGVAVLVEFRAEDETVPIKPEHKMSKQQVLKELTANGFRLVREFDGLPWQHMMFFGHADAKPAPSSR
jgi:cyclopropane fatty-acyl-phospholipid synthase-like methyltransferase